MPLCSTCSSFPFRALDKLVDSDAKTKLASGLENVVWRDSNNREFDPEEENAEQPCLWPWVKHKSVQEIYVDAPNCVLCRILCLEQSTTPGEEECYNSVHLREDFFKSRSADRHSGENEIIWMMLEKDHIWICHGNHITPDIPDYDDKQKWSAYLSVRTITGQYCHFRYGTFVLM
jgi:hypothetical protein